MIAVNFTYIFFDATKVNSRYYIFMKRSVHFDDLTKPQIISSGQTQYMLLALLSFMKQEWRK